MSKESLPFEFVSLYIRLTMLKLNRLAGRTVSSQNFCRPIWTNFTLVCIYMHAASSILIDKMLAESSVSWQFILVCSYSFLQYTRAKYSQLNLFVFPIIHNLPDWNFCQADLPNVTLVNSQSAARWYQSPTEELWLISADQTEVSSEGVRKTKRPRPGYSSVVCVIRSSTLQTNKNTLFC